MGPYQQAGKPSKILGPFSKTKVLQLQTIKAIIDSCSFKSPKSDELEECKSWACIVLLGLRAKVQVERLSY